MSPQDQKQQLFNQGQQLENIYASKIIYKNDQGQQSFPVSQQTNNQYYNQDDIDQVQNQSSYPQPQANYYPQFSGPVNTTQIAHINQMNQYNINSYPNMGISQLQNSNPNQGLSFSQPNNQFYFQIQGMQNQLSFVNNNQMPNYDQQNMMQFGRSMDANQFQNCQMGMKYPHQLYDQNLPQNIECKFYEKFDNDIYDEVNNIQRHLNITKEERNFVLQKLQNLCEKVFKEKDQKEVQKQNKIEKLQIINKSLSHPLTNKKYAGNKNQIPKIKQFGSLVTGLALESSDMDMAVTNLYLPDREKMIESLDLFAEEIKRWEMIQDLNAISTASIPVIKAVVDLKQLREKEMISLSDSQKDQDQFSQDFWQAQASSSSTAERNYFNQILQRPQIPNSLQKLKIDITFDDNITQDEDEDNKYELDMNMGFTPPHYFLTKQSFINIGLMENKTHLGISSCKLIKHYVESYKCLKEVSIVLKLYLSALQLNSPYHGGLSSYSTVLLLVAYMNKWNLRMSPTLTPSRLLMGFLDYYSYYFNVSLFGIDVSNNGSFFEHGSPESYFVILDPLNENNNTTKNSFLTHEIIKSFRKAFNSLKSKLMQYQQQQQTNINDNLLDIILERNLQKEIELDQKGNQQAQNNNKEESVQNQQTQQTQTEELMVEHCKQIAQQQTQDI